MDPTTPAGRLLRFGLFEFDPKCGELLRRVYHNGRLVNEMRQENAASEFRPHPFGFRSPAIAPEIADRTS